MRTLIQKPKGRIPKTELRNKMSNFFSSSQIKVINHETNQENCDCYTIEMDGKVYELVLFIKSISNAYLPYNRDVERIQVPHLDSIFHTHENKMFLLAGFINLNDEDVLVCWTPNDFVYHEKVRSAYVDDENIIRGYEGGYLRIIDHKVLIYISTKENLKAVINDYYTDTYIEEI